MDSGDLRIFESVARLGAMNQAASELNTVQSNVTARIRQIEDRLGVTLFERHARGVTLTAAGARLLPYAERVLTLLKDAESAVSDDGVPGGRLIVGSLETTAALRLSPVLASYAARYPSVDLTLRTGTTCELIDAVVDSDVEGAFVCGPVDHAALENQPIFEEELAVLTAPGIDTLDALAGQEDLRIVVLRAGCSYRQRLETILAKRGIAAPRVMEFGTLEAIVNCVGAGLGITLLPRGLIGPVWRDRLVRIHSLPVAESRVETSFIRRRAGHLSSAMSAFIDLARAHFASDSGLAGAAPPRQAAE